MCKRRKIEGIEDIKLLVDEFYKSVRKDELLGPIFNDFISDWSIHLPKMYRFWQTVLLNEFHYKGNPFLVHTKLPISEQHFERWLALFHKTVDSHFYGEVADDAKNKSTQISTMFQHKLYTLRHNLKNK